MTSPAEIKKRLERNWIAYLNDNASRLSMDRIDGASPPSVFVGRYGYPKVRVGPMIPPLHGNTALLDSPEQWAGKSIEEIAGYRLSLVRGTSARNVNDTSGRFVENLQDLVMSGMPVESEASFEKQPIADFDLENEINLDPEAGPFGLAAPIKHFKIFAASADQRIEDAYYDTDIRASDAIVDLYRQGIETSRIQRVLSVGMLGSKKRRKFVPTRWSITATDDVISKSLLIENEVNPSIDKYEVTRYSHLSNSYVVILLPDDVWSFEMIESWFTADGQVATGSDYEGANGLDHYPSIAGAYFAARLAVAEHLCRTGRKAAALVIREIRPEYVMPLGVWQIREGVREALRKAPTELDDLSSAISFACSGLSISRTEIIGGSKLLSDIRQKRITDFA